MIEVRNLDVPDSATKNKKTGKIRLDALTFGYILTAIVW
jgi:hypothetical protein